MKTTSPLFYLLSFIFCLVLIPMPHALSQIPQGFNYQAIARDGSGNPIKNQLLPVRLTIQSDSLGTAIIWQELHATLQTDGLGVFSLILGKGSRQTASTVALFSDIAWDVTPKFMKTEIDYSGWKTMGVSRLWSVPFAQVAGDLGGPVKKLSVEGETAALDEALFEVKNKYGQTIFAVYNEGVRIYVDDGAKGLKGGFAVGGFDMTKATKREYFVVSDDSVRIYLDSNPSTKGLKSGFAVGGYDMTKGSIQNYLDVSADSVRIYIDSDPATKKLKGGFAVGGYDMTKGIVGDYFNVSGKSEAEVIIGEPRVLWYPAKEAFRSGNVLIESKDSVGLNSWASGYRSKAIGNYSQALGYQAIARGVHSTSIGYQSVSNDSSSFALGQWAKAIKKESYAIGRGAVASGYRSFSFGSAGKDPSGNITDVPYASGDYSFALGAGAKAIGEGSMSILNSRAEGLVSLALGDGALASGDCSAAIGLDTKASGVYSTSIGMYAEASNWHTMALGWHATASGDCSMAYGSYITASGDYSAGFGYGALAEGLYSTAIGGSKAAGEFSTAIGDGAWAIGQFATAFGTSVRANGQFAQAFGRNSYANGTSSLAMGYETKAPSAFETVIGSCNTNYIPQSNTEWNSSDRLFVIGNGTSTLETYRSDAVVLLKNGNLGIGSSSPTGKLEVNLANSLTWSGNLKALRVLTPDNGYYLDLNTSIISAGNAGYHFNPNGNTGLTISTPGNVGIGTSNPTFHLDIASGSLASTINSSVLWQRLYGYTSNQDQLKVRHRRFLTGTDWSSAEIRIQKTVDATDMGYISFKADYLEMGLGSTANLTLKNGNIGIGNSDPGYKLVVNGTAWCSSGAWTGSDGRWKKDISDMKNVLIKIIQLQPVNYKLRTDEFPEMYFETGEQIGLIAQDVEKILPALVKTDKDGYKAVAYDKLSSVLVEAIKEQQQQIQSQQTQIDELKAMVDKLMSGK